jgi:alkylmercury lyase
VRVELLYFEGCPSSHALLPRLQQLLREAGVETRVESRRIGSEQEALEERFLGSPTVRIDGRDVEPGAELREDFGMKCRLYRRGAAYGSVPLEGWIVASIERARLRDGLSAELEAGRPHFDERQQRLAVALYRLMAEGEPVGRERLAERTGANLDELSRLLARQPGVYLDERGQVIGFWGMALHGMPHRLQIEGRTVRAWCALDALFLPRVLGKTATVESPCPTTGEMVTLTVHPHGVRDVSPEGAVLSFLHLDGRFDEDTIKSFCHFVHFFSSEEAAREWTARHEGTFSISIEDGFEIGRRITTATFGAAIGIAQPEGSAV